jgi:hypothetical protein
MITSRQADATATQRKHIDMSTGVSIGVNTNTIIAMTIRSLTPTRIIFGFMQNFYLPLATFQRAEARNRLSG